MSFCWDPNNRKKNNKIYNINEEGFVVVRSLNYDQGRKCAQDPRPFQWHIPLYLTI